MGILDDLKNKVEKLGDKAKEGFDDARDKAGDLLDDARDKAGDLIDDARERIGHQDDEGVPLSESADIGPDSSSTDAVQPGYVTAEDEVTGTAADESSLNDDLADDAEDDEPEGGVTEVEDEDFAADAPGSADVAAPAAELDAEELTGSDDPAPAGADTAEPVVETDVDPYDEPLTETIGDEIAADLVDPDAVAAAVDDPSDRDARP